MDIAKVKNDLYKGSLAAVLRIILAVPIYIVLTPFILEYLKQDQFAIWSFNSTIIGLINLTDLGFKSSLLFHCAQTPGDQTRIKLLFGTALTIYIGLWIVVVVTCWLLQEPITKLLGVPDHLRGPAGFVIVITAVGFGLRFIATPFQAVIEAHYGVRYSQHVLLMWLVVNAAATLLVLPFHPDLYAMGWISLLGNALVLIAFYVQVRRKLPFLGWTSISLDAGTTRALLKYGAGIYVATIVITLREPLYKIFLSSNFGLDQVATFEIAFRLCTQVVSAVISPLLGIFTAAAVLSKRPADLAIVLRPLCGVTLLVLAPLALFMMSFSSSLTALWLGPSTTDVARLLPWMFAAFSVYYATEILYQSILGNGWSNYAALVQGISLGLMAAVLYLLRDSGAIESTGLSLVVGFSAFSIVNLIAFRRRFAAVKLFDAGMLAMFATPSIAYCAVLCLSENRQWLMAAAFSVYVVVHVVVAKKLGIADLTLVVRRLIPRIA